MCNRHEHGLIWTDRINGNLFCDKSYCLSLGISGFGCLHRFFSFLLSLIYPRFDPFCVLCWVPCFLLSRCSPAIFERVSSRSRIYCSCRFKDTCRQIRSSFGFLIMIKYSGVSVEFPDEKNGKQGVQRSAVR